MATIQSITAQRAQEIEDASVISGTVNGSGHLILTTAGGATIDAGAVVDSSGVIAHAALTTGIHGVGAGFVVGTTLSQALTNKTLVTPVIGSFTNAQHTHADANNGGPISVFSGVKAVRTATQGIADSTSELVNFNAVSAYDTNSYKTSGTVFTIPSNGYYDIVAKVPWDANLNNRRSVDIRLNDTSTNATAGSSLNRAVLAPAHAANFPMTVSALGEYLTAGNTIKIYAWQNSGGALNILGNTGGTPTELTIKRVF